jgi:hypothetical protein
MPEDGKISFRIHNRFCHTNLSEIKLLWKIGSSSGSIMCPSIRPAENGIITFPVQDVKRGDIVEMAFQHEDGFQVDEYSIPVGPEQFVLPEFCGKAPVVNENESSFIVSGDRFRIEISKRPEDSFGRL